MDACETFAAVQCVADGLRGRAAAGQAGERRGEPGEQVIDEGAAPLLADGAVEVGRLAAHLCLDGVERGDARSISWAIGAVFPFARSMNSRRTWLQQNASGTPSPAAASVW